MLLLSPTETPPAPENDRLPAWLTPELVVAVVLPEAYRDSPAAVCAAVVAAMMIEELDIPTLTMPEPLSVRAESACVSDDVAPVVLPVAVTPCDVARFVGPETMIDELDNPTLMLPAPTNVREPAPCTPEEVAAVVLLDA